MSWFDTSSLANIAKTALKEAQRTIDKALDIQDDTSSVSPNIPLDTNSEDFFDSWGVSSVSTTKESKASSLEDVVTKSPTKSKLTTSLWGSFSGSFFDSSKETAAATTEKKHSIESLDDSIDLQEEHFNKSKLVVQQSEEDGLFFQSSSSVGANNSDFVENGSSQTSKTQSTSVKEKESNNEYKDSSQSVESLSGETDYMRTPDSDLLSPGLTSSVSGSDIREKSQSLEVIPDSLTSPSSVEVLSMDPTNSRELEENISSSICSDLEDKLQSTLDNSSPDSVEIIQENGDECSIIDDTVSFASASERTVLESDPHSSQQQKPLACNEHAPLTNEKFFSFSENSEVALKLIDTQPQNSKDTFLNVMDNSNVIDIPQDSHVCLSSLQENHFDDDGSQSDRTIIASTDNIMESSSDTASTSTENNANSVYFKTIIADAMSEKSIIEEAIRSSVERKPVILEESSKVMEVGQKKEDVTDMSISQMEMRESLSSGSRSDLVKIESDQTSGHTSGDEIETTTSSDIEIISSPNGDSSSTHSRHSPAKVTGFRQKCSETNVDALLGKMTLKKIKGHNRELSEASSISDDLSEIDRLIRRITEMTEILEYREAKLIEVNRNNVELQELNVNLQQQLDVMLTKQMESVDLSQVTEEYTRRLSILEKKFQQAIREKDNLQKQLDQTKQEAATRMSKSDLEALISEKDQVIRELREEGEKLSKQQLQHSNIIKKLRAKEKEHESTLKRLKENIEDLTSENERLKKSLVAKDEVEHSQIEAVHQLTAKNKKLEYDASQLESQVEDLTQKYETVKKSLDAAKKELSDKNKTNSELQLRQQMLKSLENEKRMTESQNEEILGQIEDLRLKVQESDQEMIRREQHLKTENNELLKRLEAAETRNEELAQSVMEVSKPLVRQLEALQATHSMKLASFEKVEQELLASISELQSKLQTATVSEKVQKEECQKLRSKVSELESQLATAEHRIGLLKMEVEQTKTEKMIAEQEMKREIENCNARMKQDSETIGNLRKDKQHLEQQLSVERSTVESEKRKASENAHERGDSLASKSSPLGTRNTSPTVSVGHVSLSESLGSSVFLPDDQSELPIPTRFNNMLELQMLQSSLKQKEGELQQLQWELSRREHERTLLNAQISNLLNRVEALEVNLAEHESLKTQFADLQRQYETLCQLYGEKVEEAEELKLDLQDVKELYKTQLNDLLQQQQND